MKELIILLVIVVVLILGMGHVTSTFSEECRLKGGVPHTKGYSRVCYAPGVTIDVD